MDVCIRNHGDVAIKHVDNSHSRNHETKYPRWTNSSLENCLECRYSSNPIEVLRRSNQLIEDTQIALLDFITIACIPPESPSSFDSMAW